MLSELGDKKFSTILADPPWRFSNRSGRWNTQAMTSTPTSLSNHESHEWHEYDH